MLQEWFFLELNVIAPFVAETCIAYTAQLRTPAQSSHNGGMAVTDQGDLHQPLYLLFGCLHGYKSVGGWASQYSSLIAIGIEIHISAKNGTFSNSYKGCHPPRALWVGTPVPHYNTRRHPQLSLHTRPKVTPRKKHFPSLCTETEICARFV